MGKGKYFSAYTGKQLDEAIRAIINAGLDNLLHDRGVYKTEEKLPKNGIKLGDYAYVGTDYEAMDFYQYGESGWTNTGKKVNLYERNATTVSQEFGDSETLVISQKAITDKVRWVDAMIVMLKTGVDGLRATIQSITDEGFNVTDEEGNIGMKYDKNGLDVALLSEHLKSLIKEIDGLGLSIGNVTGTAFDGGIGTAMQAVVSKLNAIVNEIRPLVQSITEEGFNVTDSSGNVGMKYDAEGLDVARLSAHIQELIRAIPGIGSGGGTTYENLFQVSDEGFYVVDSDGNIGFGLNAAGETLGGGGGLEYEVISEIDYDV